ncbi:hypothetical protein [Fodinicola feengrottensis]|uniref:hypothetical protein n=1 Tax=Fodinicola feengrottensis TaxID=435914 RepID=UPI0013D7E8B0|nr:hypothetical protein [Fodinicola feengrottensis]
MTAPAGAAPLPRPATQGNGGAVRLHTNVTSFGPARPAPQGSSTKRESSAETGKTVVRPNYEKSTILYGPLNIGPYEAYQAWVDCPAGMVATGGGESNTSAGGIFPHDSYALDNGAGWQVTVSNNSSVSATYTVNAVCVNGLNSYRQVRGKDLLPANGAGGVAATCAPNELVLGGGGFSDTINNHAVTYPYPSANSWWYGMHNLDGVQRTITTQAMCGGYNGSYQVLNGSYSDVAPGHVATAVVYCPVGTSVTSGGGGGGDGTFITDSYPDPSEGWRVYAYNSTTSPGVVSADVVCVG